MHIKSSWGLAVVTAEGASVAIAYLWPDAPWILVAWFVLWGCTSILIAMGIDGIRLFHKNYLNSNKKVVEEFAIVPDINMGDAIDHVKSILFPNSDPNDLDYQMEMPKVTNQITEKIKAGELTTWGKRVEKLKIFDTNLPRMYELKVHLDQEIFSTEDWTHRELLPLESSIPTEKTPQTHSVGRKDDHIQFTALQVNKEELSKIWPCPKTVEYILMSDVARMAYEKHRTEDTYELSSASFSDGFASASNNESDVLNGIAMAITLSGADVFGKHAPSTVFEKIHPNIEDHFIFGDGGNSLHPMGNDNPEFIDVSIKKLDIDKIIAKINEYSGTWYGNKFVLDEPVTILYLPSTKELLPTICYVPCPPNSLAELEYNLHYGNPDNNPYWSSSEAHISLGTPGNNKEPNLTGTGKETVIVSRNSEVQVLLKNEQGFEVFIGINLIGWEKHG